ncbi:MAG: ferredoxin reductase, partial [Sphingomonadaceae bacterium]
MSYVIAQVFALGSNIREFQIRRSDGGALPDWQAGAHIVLGFSNAAGQRFQNHYSLVGAPGPSTTYRIAVQREADGHGGSRCLHDEYGAGRSIEVSGPFNSFPLQAGNPAGSRVLLVAGGIGITPLVSMAYALDAQGATYALHYLARTQQQLVLLEELRALPHGKVEPRVSQQTGRVDLSALL